MQFQNVDFPEFATKLSDKLCECISNFVIRKMANNAALFSQTM